MDQEHLRTGDRALCHFRFIKNPEYIQAGTKMIFREGRTKAVGTITRLFNEIPGQSSHNTRAGKSHKAQMHNKAQQSKRSRNAPKKPAQPPQNEPAATTDKHSAKSATNIANGHAITNTAAAATTVRTAEN